jgi:hypothetical protein
MHAEGQYMNNNVSHVHMCSGEQSMRTTVNAQELTMPDHSGGNGPVRRFLYMATS